MFETRYYPDIPQDYLTQFEHTDPDLAESLTSPFPAIVFTLDRELLGFGRVLGRLDELDQTVIEVNDPLSPTGKTHLFDFECYWGVRTAEAEALYSHPTTEVVSALAYVSFIDTIAQSYTGIN